MSRAKHQHAFGWDGQEPTPCPCGAEMTAIEAALTPAASDARRMVGEVHYTGSRLRHDLEVVELWMCDAPSQVLEKLEASHPGVYLIHNDAPRPRTRVDDLRASFDWPRWKAEGINVWVVGPTEDGYLNVGVEGDLETAQNKLDAAYGHNVVRVAQRGPISALTYPGRSQAHA